MNELLLNFVKDLLRFPWEREEFISCKSLRESYDTFKGKIGDCSFEEYEKFFRSLNKKTFELENLQNKLSVEDLDKVSGGVNLIFAVPMILLSLFSNLTNTISMANESAPTQKIEYSTAALTEPQKNQESFSEEEWEQTRNFIARAGDPWLSTLPVEGEIGLDKYLDVDNLGPFQECDKTTKTEIEATVKELIAKVDEMTPTEGMSEEEIQQKIDSGKISKYYKLPRDLRIAEAIYSWVATHIRYDYKLSSDLDNSSFRTNRSYFYKISPGVVFKRKDGICIGYSTLTKLMMRMANIPCTTITSRKDKKGVGHAFNAIYVKKANGEKGWTLIDTTWGGGIEIGDKELYGDDTMMRFGCYEDEEYGIHAFAGAGFHIEKFLNNIKREYKYEENSKVVDEYISKVNSMFEDEFSKNKESFNQDRKTTVDKINVSIKKKIEKLNHKYKDKEFTKLIKCEFSLYKDGADYESLRINLENSHSEGKAKKLVEESNLHRYFPAFYNEDTTLAEDNNNIVKKRAHSIRCVTWDDNLLHCGTYIINGVKYEVDNNCIEVSSASGKKVALEIPKAILDQKLKFIIGPGIEKLKLAGDEKIDISNASDLKYVDTTNSTRYRFEEGIFYDGDTLLSRVFTECRF